MELDAAKQELVSVQEQLTAVRQSLDEQLQGKDAEADALREELTTALSDYMELQVRVGGGGGGADDSVLY